MGVEKRYKLYVFDFDGTLVDTRTDMARAYGSVAYAAGRDVPSRQTIESVIGGGSVNAVRKLTGLDGDDLKPFLDAFKLLYDAVCADNTTVYEGAYDLLERLRAQGALLALVTMKYKTPTYKILKKHGFDMFDEVVTFDDIEKRKPDPDSLIAMMDKYNVRPSEVLMIGDTVTDMRYATAAGVDACAMTYGYGVTAEVLAESPRYKLESFCNF